MNARMYLALAFLCVLAGGAMAGLQPNLVALHGRPTQELGRVAVGAAAGRRVVLVNVSDRAVELDIEAKSCGCVTASIDPSVVMPGASAAVRFETIVQHIAGTQTHGITVRARPADSKAESETQRLVLTMLYEAALDYEVLPERLDAVGIVGTPIRLRIFVHDISGGALRIAPPTTNLPRAVVAIESSPTATPDAQAAFACHTVVLDWTPIESGVVRGSVFLETNSTVTPKLRIPFTVRVRSGWRASCAGVVLGPTEPANRVEVLLAPPPGTSRQEDSERLRTAFDPALPGVTCEASTVAGGQVRLRVLSVPSAASPVSGESVLRVHAGDREIASIPVVWLVMPQRR